MLLLHTAAQERNSRGLVALLPCLLFPVELCLLFCGHLHKRNLIRLAAYKRHGVTDQFTAVLPLHTAAQERNSRGVVALLEEEEVVVFTQSRGSAQHATRGGGGGGGGGFYS